MFCHLEKYLSENIIIRPHPKNGMLSKAIRNLTIRCIGRMPQQVLLGACGEGSVAGEESEKEGRGRDRGCGVSGVYGDVERYIWI